MGDITFWEFGFRVLVLYIVVMVALRVMGKREIGQLSVFDFVISVMIAELSTLPMEDTAVPLYRSLLAISSLVVLQLVVAVIQLKSHRFRHWVDGEPTVLIEHGEIKDREMKRTRYTMHDLLTQLREKGFANAADVEFAILETSGKLSVFPVAEKRPLTPGDISQQVKHDTIPLPIIIDGEPVQKTLSLLHRDRTWLSQEIQLLGYGDVTQVFFAAVDESGKLIVDEKDPEPSKTSPGASKQVSNSKTGKGSGKSQDPNYG